jgi:hypothetical protein
MLSYDERQSMVTEDKGSSRVIGDVLQTLPALLLALSGLLIAAVVTLILFSRGMGAQDIAAVAGIFTGITGTLVGTFLGVHVGAAGKMKLQADRDSAVAKMERAMARLPEQDRRELAGE